MNSTHMPVTSTPSDVPEQRGRAVDGSLGRAVWRRHAWEGTAARTVLAAGVASGFTALYSRHTDFAARALGHAGEAGAGESTTRLPVVRGHRVKVARSVPSMAVDRTVDAESGPHGIATIEAESTAGEFPDAPEVRSEAAAGAAQTAMSMPVRVRAPNDGAAAAQAEPAIRPLSARAGSNDSPTAVARREDASAGSLAGLLDPSPTLQAGAAASTRSSEVVPAPSRAEAPQRQDVDIAPAGGAAETVVRVGRAGRARRIDVGASPTSNAQAPRAFAVDVARRADVDSDAGSLADTQPSRTGGVDVVRKVVSTDLAATADTKPLQQVSTRDSQHQFASVSFPLAPAPRTAGATWDASTPSAAAPSPADPKPVPGVGLPPHPHEPPHAPMAAHQVARAPRDQGSVGERPRGNSVAAAPTTRARSVLARAAGGAPASSELTVARSAVERESVHGTPPADDSRESVEPLVSGAPGQQGFAGDASAGHNEGGALAAAASRPIPADPMLPVARAARTQEPRIADVVLATAAVSLMREGETQRISGTHVQPVVRHALAQPDAPSPAGSAIHTMTSSTEATEPRAIVTSAPPAMPAMPAMPLVHPMSAIVARSTRTPPDAIGRWTNTSSPTTALSTGAPESATPGAAEPRASVAAEPPVTPAMPVVHPMSAIVARSTRMPPTSIGRWANTSSPNTALATGAPESTTPGAAEPRATVASEPPVMPETPATPAIPAMPVVHPMSAILARSTRTPPDAIARWTNTSSPNTVLATGAPATTVARATGSSPAIATRQAEVVPAGAVLGKPNGYPIASISVAPVVAPAGDGEAWPLTATSVSVGETPVVQRNPALTVAATRRNTEQSVAAFARAPLAFAGPAPFAARSSTAPPSALSGFDRVIARPSVRARTSAPPPWAEGVASTSFEAAAPTDRLQRAIDGLPAADERSVSGPPQPAQQPQPSAGPGALPAQPAVDIDDLVERALRALMFRLEIESERRGLNRWA
jgi:hypothetical protein